jgi:multidrug efflux pump subunit AcrA (membrane-fusion protein)
MSKTTKWIRTSLAAGAVAAFAAGAASAQLDEALRTAQQSTQEGAQAQRQIDDIADRTASLEGQYLALRQQIEDQRIFIEQQQVFLRSQQNELEELTAQLDRVSGIERDLTPMMLEMYVRLEEFVENDLPFQVDQRRARLDNIERVLGSSEFPPSERYRVLLSAFEIEAAYGRGLTTYTEEVEVDGTPEEANILRFGRLAMIRIIRGNMEIMTSDNLEWRPLPGQHANNVQRALRIAQEVTTPEVFLAPVSGPVVQ